MSRINAEGTIITALRVAAEIYDRRAREAQAMRDELEDGSLRIVVGTSNVMDEKRRAMLAAALLDAALVYDQDASDSGLARIREQFERQASEARLVSSQVTENQLHVIQSLRVVPDARS